MEIHPHTPKTDPNDSLWPGVAVIGAHLMFVALLWFDHPWAAMVLIGLMYGAVMGISLNCGSHSLCCNTPKPTNFWRD